MLLTGTPVLREPEGSPQFICQYGTGQEDDRPMWDSTCDKPDSKMPFPIAALWVQLPKRTSDLFTELSWASPATVWHLPPVCGRGGQ